MIQIYYKNFDLLRKPTDYRTYVRRRRGFACLWRFFDLWQFVKKEFFDKLRARCKKQRALRFILCFGNPHPLYGAIRWS